MHSASYKGLYVPVACLLLLPHLHSDSLVSCLPDEMGDNWCLWPPSRVLLPLLFPFWLCLLARPAVPLKRTPARGGIYCDSRATPCRQQNNPEIKAQPTSLNTWVCFSKGDPCLPTLPSTQPRPWTLRPMWPKVELPSVWQFVTAPMENKHTT